MPTNILSLPLLTVTSETATNESWRDGVAFTTAGSITYRATGGNAGTGIPNGLSVVMGAEVGSYNLSLTDANTFQLAAPDGYIIGSGAVGSPFSASGVAFTLTQGQVPFVAGDSFALTVLPKPIDITGIRFVMQMRRSAQDATILVSGDTDQGTLINGLASGVLGWAIPVETMGGVAISGDGSPYVFDVVAIADGDQRRCVSGTNAVVCGITVPAGQ